MESEEEPEGIRGRLLRIADLGLPTIALLGLSYATLLAALVLHATARWSALGARIAQFLPIIGWVLLALPIFWLTSNDEIIVWMFVVFFAFSFLTYFPEPLQFNLLVGNPALLLDPLQALVFVLLSTEIICYVIYFATRLLWPLAVRLDEALGRAPNSRVASFVRGRIVRYVFGLPFLFVLDAPVPTYLFLSFLIVASVFFSAPNALSIYSESTPADALRTHLANVSLLLIPVLFLAGSDYAEIAHVAASRAYDGYGRAISRPSFAVVAAGVSVAIALVAVVMRGPYASSAVWLLVAQGLAVAVAVCAAIALWNRGSSARVAGHVPQATLVAAAVAYCVLYLAITYGPDYVGSTHTYRASATAGAPAYTIVYPARWVLRTGDLKAYGAQTIAVLLGEKDDRPDVSAPRVIVAIRPAGASSSPNAWVPTAGTIVGDVGQRYAASGWFRTVGDHEWAIVGLGTSAADLASQMRFLTAIRDSWRLGIAPDASSIDRPAVLAALVLAASVFAATWRRGRLFRALPPISRLFLAVFGIYNFIELASSALAASTGTNVDLPLLPIAALTVGVASLALGVRRIVRHESADAHGDASLVALNVAMIVLVVLDGGFNVMRRHEDAELLRAIVVATALTWDLLMSGGTFTNRDSASFPRTARVLLFGGYVVMVAACAANGAPLNIIGASTTPFDSDAWAIDGLNRLGVPLLLALFATRAFSPRYGAVTSTV